MLLDSFETKSMVLAEFLKICVFDGWNDEALEKSVKNCGIDQKFTNLIFENGLIDLINFYIESQNEKSLQSLPDLSLEKIRNKIRFSLYARFEVEQENKLALQRLLAFYANPKNFVNFKYGPRPIFNALHASYKVADFIWKNINDQSTDFNFYTKRLTLAKIILRSLFVFVKDESENFSVTKKFIDSQIEKVMQFEKFKAKLRNFQAKSHFKQFFLDEEGFPKTPKEIIKNLPFFRLRKK